MKPCANRGGNSSIQSYEIGEDYITIFHKKSSKPYTWSHRSINSHHLDNMKQLAENGSGLNSYIMLNVKNDFER